MSLQRRISKFEQGDWDGVSLGYQSHLVDYRCRDPNVCRTLLAYLARPERRAGISFRFHHLLEEGIDEHRESLSAFKLEVAKSYASMACLKDVEIRLTRHLQRIEDKLDNQIQRCR